MTRAMKQVEKEATKQNGELARVAPGVSAETPVRLNLGGGDTYLLGFTNVDRRTTGGEAFPLDVPDGSVEEIVATHLLEHFSFRRVEEVLRHWVAKLAPGGRIRLAVPDFEALAEAYVGGATVPLMPEILGGHVDENDHHGALFDRDSLRELMTGAGLERIGPWDVQAVGCASRNFSLNLMGYKPSGAPPWKLETTHAVMSVPRFGPLQHPRCAEKAFFLLGIKGKSTQSCFWHQQICELMEEAVAEGAEYVLTMDFDTVFAADDVLELHRLMMARPDVDAIFPLQAKRGCTDALFSLTDRKGRRRQSVTAGELSLNLLEANTGHFGLTLFRASSLARFERPWMIPRPNQRNGRYDGNHVDADIDFWDRFKKAGLVVCLAPKVVVGHIEETVAWPGPLLERVYQPIGDYEEQGIPAAVRR